MNIQRKKQILDKLTIFLMGVVIGFVALSLTNRVMAESFPLPATPVDVMTVDLSSVECMALNIYHEARGERKLGREIVAQVTLNRVGHPSGMFADDICGVVKQVTRSAKTGKLVAQFTWTKDGRSDEAKDTDAYRDAFIMSIEFIVFGKRLNDPFASILLNYHTTAVNPDWHDLIPLILYDNQIYYARRDEYERLRSTIINQACPQIATYHLVEPFSTCRNPFAKSNRGTRP